MKKLILTIISLILCSTAIFSQDYKDLVPETDLENCYIEFTQNQQLTQERIKLLMKKNPLAKLGKEVVKGKISGEILYDCQLQGLGAVCTITYTNYSDEPGWIFNGYVVTTVDVRGDGNFRGAITATGDQNITVHYDNALLRHSVVTEGTYGVEYEDEPRVELPYTWFIYAMSLIGR